MTTPQHLIRQGLSIVHPTEGIEPMRFKHPAFDALSTRPRFVGKEYMADGTTRPWVIDAEAIPNVEVEIPTGWFGARDKYRAALTEIGAKFPAVTITELSPDEVAEIKRDPSTVDLTQMSITSLFEAFAPMSRLPAPDDGGMVSLTALPSHRDDPHTSRDAAVKAENGAAALRVQVLLSLRLYGPQTADEIADRMGLHRSVIAKRISDLHTEGKVHRRETGTNRGLPLYHTRTSKAGAMACVWYLSPENFAPTAA